MSQTRSVKNPIYIQDDLSDIKLLCEEGSLSVFTAKQTSESGDSKQTVRVLTDIHNHYALKREKDLLHYLNKFSDDFPKFNEIRKEGFSYLKFFDFVGKKSLKDVVKKKGVFLSPEEAKKLLEHMVSALDKVHGVGFVHTRIRPETSSPEKTIIIWSTGAARFPPCHRLKPKSCSATKILPAGAFKR